MTREYCGIADADKGCLNPPGDPDGPRLTNICPGCGISVCFGCSRPADGKRYCIDCAEDPGGRVVLERSTPKPTERRLPARRFPTPNAAMPLAERLAMDPDLQEMVEWQVERGMKPSDVRAVAGQSGKWSQHKDAAGRYADFLVEWGF